MHNLSPITVKRKSQDLSIDLYKRVPGLKELAQIDVKVLMNKDSSSMRVEDWEEIGEAILEKYTKYDGFVVIHGTDTMVYTASALSFMFRNLSKPIIITGSQRPLTEIRSDAARNLINAVDIAANSKINEVAVFFDRALLRGNRSIKSSIEDYAAFESPNYSEIAKVGLEVSYTTKYLLEKPKATLLYDNRFAKDVMFIKFFPSINLSLFVDAVKSDKFSGIVIEAFGAGNLPCEDALYQELLHESKKRKIPIVIVSQSVSGTVNLELYEAGSKSLSQNAISGRDMTSEAAIVKMMKLLGENVSYKEFPKKFTQSIAGEIS